LEMHLLLFSPSNTSSNNGNNNNQQVYKWDIFKNILVIFFKCLNKMATDKPSTYLRQYI
jgi:hypothetical protein